MSITQYCYERKNNWNTPQELQSLLAQGGFTECKIPLELEFKQAYDMAIDLVGVDHFMVSTRTSFWFESDVLAIQYRLSLQ